MTLEELSRVLQAMGIQSNLLCYFYRQTSESRAELGFLWGYGFVMGGNIGTNRSPEGREERG